MACRQPVSGRMGVVAARLADRTALHGGDASAILVGRVVAVFADVRPGAEPIAGRCATRMADH